MIILIILYRLYYYINAIARQPAQGNQTSSICLHVMLSSEVMKKQLQDIQMTEQILRLNWRCISKLAISFPMGY